MSNGLQHLPSRIMQQWLLDKGLGTDPELEGPWSVFYTFMPDEDKAGHSMLCAYDTEGILTGRTMPDGETNEHYGINIRIRDDGAESGYQKALAIADAWDQVWREEVIVEDVVYLIQSINRSGSLIGPMFDTPNSRRRIFSLNATVCLFALAGTGT